MINYNFPLIGGKVIERRISEWIDKGRDEGRVEGRVEGVVEGIVKGRAEERAEWSAWNSRRMEAERNGVFFNEPPPDEVSR